MEYLRNQYMPLPAEIQGLPGVNLAPYLGTSEERTQALESAKILVDSGVEFANCDADRVPWLVAVHPFRMTPKTRQKVESLGAATFAFFDAVQRLYADGNPIGRSHLDANLPRDLCGLQVEKGVETFRLDIVLHNGAPKVTEVEEIYGNAGKMSALQRAYDVNYDALFRFFADQEFSTIYLDDGLPDYYSELDLVRKELAANHCSDTTIKYFSEFTGRERGTVWRFCKTKDFAQYAPDIRQLITGSKCNFLNPLFQSYGTKAALALPFHSELVESDRFDVPFLHPDLSTLALMPRSRIRLGPNFTRSGDGIRLVAGHATFVNTSRKVHLGKHAVCAPLVV